MEEQKINFTETTRQDPNDSKIKQKKLQEQDKLKQKEYEDNCKKDVKKMLKISKRNIVL